MNLRKTIAFLIFFFILGITLKAQEAIQLDYFKALTLNTDELKLYMSKLGLIEKNMTKDESGYDFSWIFKREAIAPAKDESHIHIYYQKDRTKILSFQTDFREDYLRFKKTVQFNGLKLCKEKNYNDFLIEIFANAQFESTIYAKPDNHIMHYEISLKKLK
ncbi:MAG: hypothetical protein ACOYOT_04685 [Bacteroidales bacterium]